MAKAEQHDNYLPEFELSLAGQILLDIMERRIAQPGSYRSFLQRHWTDVPGYKIVNAQREITPKDRESPTASARYWSGLVLDHVMNLGETLERDLASHVPAAELGDL